MRRASCKMYSTILVILAERLEYLVTGPHMFLQAWLIFTNLWAVVTLHWRCSTVLVFHVSRHCVLVNEFEAHWTLKLVGIWRDQMSMENLCMLVYFVTKDIHVLTMPTSKMIMTGKRRASASSDLSYWFRFWTTDHMFLQCTALMSSLHVGS